MSGFLTIVGWMLFGGAGGYAIHRWKFVYVVFIALLGLSLVSSPTPPRLLGDGGGSWGETVAFIGGVWIGSWVAKREKGTLTTREGN